MFHKKLPTVMLLKRTTCASKIEPSHNEMVCWLFKISSVVIYIYYRENENEKTTFWYFHEN